MLDRLFFIFFQDTTRKIDLCQILPWLSTSPTIAPLWVRPCWTAPKWITPSPAEFCPIYFASLNQNMTCNLHLWFLVFRFHYKTCSLYNRLYYLTFVIMYLGDTQFSFFDPETLILIKFSSDNENVPEAVVQRCPLRKGILRNFTKFTGKHLYQSLFFNKVAGMRLLLVFLQKLHICRKIDSILFINLLICACCSYSWVRVVPFIPFFITLSVFAKGFMSVFECI